MSSTSAPSGFPVVVDGVVFRLANVTDTFPADSEKPLAYHFQFSSEEKDEATAGRPWLLSVWDRDLTSIDDARQLASVTKDRLAFALPVVGINAITLKTDTHPLWIIRDVRTGDSRRGAAGHCGLFGIHRADRTERKALRDKICEKAYRL